MGKAKPKYTYTATCAGDRRWIGRVKEESGLTIEEETHPDAITAIKALHRELLDDKKRWKEDENG